MPHVTPPHLAPLYLYLSSHFWIRYRVPIRLARFHRKLAVGIFSVPNEKGAERRALIRKTWAQNQDAVFVLGGPWEAVKEEFASEQVGRVCERA